VHIFGSFEDLDGGFRKAIDYIIEDIEFCNSTYDNNISKGLYIEQDD